MNKKFTLNKRNVDELKTLLDNKQINFYQFYNTEFNSNEYPYYEYLDKYKNLDDSFYLAKNLNKTYYDIETLFDPEKAPDPENTPFPVTSIAVYNNIQNTCYVLFLKDKKHNSIVNNITEFKNGIINEYNEIVKNNPIYNVQDMNIEVEVFDLEEALLKRLFRLIIETNSFYLIGFNSQSFDDQYTVNRLIKLIGEQRAYETISDFDVMRYGSLAINQPEYTRSDIFVMYKPVDQGGMNMGKSLPDYKLTTIANVELDIEKIDLEGDFNEIYYNNPVHFAVYNMFDTILTFKLDEKLKFLEDLYSLAKYNNCGVFQAIKGRSFLFQYRNNFHYTKEEKLGIRHAKFNKEIYYEIQ